MSKRQSIIGNARLSQMVDPENVPTSDEPEKDPANNKPKTTEPKPEPKNNTDVEKNEQKETTKSESPEAKEKFAPQVTQTKSNPPSGNVPTRSSRRKKDKDNKRKSWISGVGKRISGFFSKLFILKKSFLFCYIVTF